ncbi:hypothetical protein C8Q80DRAFT_1155286 [Daedaleopsis nitida]|nr:hypothetical protein C8Q80DRAFT_1155286 [Daedaleopsis nitida]
MARLQQDLARIRTLQGDEPGLPPTQQFLGSVESTVQQLQASLKTAAAAAVEAPPPAPAPQVQMGRERKRPRVAGAGSIKLPSPVPVSGSAYNSVRASSVPKTALSRKVHPRMSPVQSRRTHASSRLADDDAEGDDDEDGGDAEDQELYCYCQERSYGEMIACDNDGCRFQWFHTPCIKLPANETLPDIWYCDECSALLGLGSTTAGGGRKGRRK